MSSSYRIERRELMEALDDIELFKTRMDKFIDKYPSYSYTVDISEDNTSTPDKWIVQVTIEKNEHENNTEI